MNDDVKKDRDQIIAEDLARVEAMSDEDIDLSDIPQMTDEQWSRAVRGKFHRPMEDQGTGRDDADSDS